MNEPGTRTSFQQELAAGRVHLRQAAAALIDCADALAQDTGPVQDIVESLDRQEVFIVVAGEVNRGKSTFLNALLSSKVFPPRAVVCTAVLSELRHGEPRYQGFARDGSTFAGRLPLEDAHKDLMTIVSRRNPSAKELERVAIWFPNRFTREGIVIVDTPGVNDPVEWREAITVGMMKRADAAVFLLDAHAPLSLSERTFLDNYIIGEVAERVLFVVNKCDGLTERELDSVRDRCERELARHVSRPQISYVQCLPALKARLAGDEAALASSGFGRFEADLDWFLRDHRLEIVLGPPRDRLARVSRQYSEDVQLRLAALEEEDTAIRSRLASAQQELADIERRTRERQRTQNKTAAEWVGRVKQEARRRWQQYADAAVLSPHSISRIQSAYADNQSRGDEVASAQVASARKEAGEHVEGLLGTMCNELAVDAGRELMRVETAIVEVRKLVATTSTGLAPETFSSAAFSFGGNLLSEAEKARTLADAVVGSAIGIVAIVVGVGAFLTEMVAGEGTILETRVRAKMRSIVEKGEVMFVREYTSRAEAVLRGFEDKVSRENRQRIGLARTGLKQVEKEIARDRSSIESRRTSLRTFVARLRRIRETLERATT